jgi:hypothetical protein
LRWDPEFRIITKANENIKDYIHHLRKQNIELEQMKQQKNDKQNSPRPPQEQMFSLPLLSFPLFTAQPQSKPIRSQSESHSDSHSQPQPQPQPQLQLQHMIPFTNQQIEHSKDIASIEQRKSTTERSDSHKSDRLCPVIIGTHKGSGNSPRQSLIAPLTSSNNAEHMHHIEENTISHNNNNQANSHRYSNEWLDHSTHSEKDANDIADRRVSL